MAQSITRDNSFITATSYPLLQSARRDIIVGIQPFFFFFFVICFHQEEPYNERNVSKAF